MCVRVGFFDKFTMNVRISMSLPEKKSSILYGQRKMWRKREPIGEKQEDKTYEMQLLGSVYLKPRESGFKATTPIVYPDDARMKRIYQEKGKSLSSTSQATTMNTVSPVEETNRSCCNCHCPKIRCPRLETWKKAFFSHERNQIVGLFILFDIICAVALLMFKFRGIIGTLEPTPTTLTTDQLTVGQVTIMDEEINGAGDLEITGNISTIEDMLIVGPGYAELPRTNLKAPSVTIGDISFVEAGGFGATTVEISSSSGIVNVAGDVEVEGPFTGTMNANLGGIIFGPDGCVNCKWIPDKSEILADKDQSVPFLVRSGFGDSMGRLVLIGDEMMCVGDKCREKDLSENVSNIGAVLAERKLWNGVVRMILDRGEWVTILEDETVVRQVLGSSKHAEIVVDMNGRVWDVIVFGNRVEITSGQFGVEQKVDGTVLKLRTVVNELNEVLVFVLTTEGLFVVSMIESEIRARKVVDCAVADFDVVSANLENIVLGVIKSDGVVSFGACRDSQCEVVRLHENSSGKRRVKTIAMAIGTNGMPIIGLGDGETTTVTRCGTAMCVGDVLE